MGNQFFATRIKQLRQDRGITMEKLAQELNVTKSRVNMWENGGAIPRSQTLIDLANYFGVSTDYLVGNDCEKKSDPSSDKLHTLQRNLGKLNEKDLERAEGMLKAVFMDIFEDDEEDEDDM
ncbi:helix-turn-helix domain-containing protein [Butyrivibrio hungatei]|uniref:HTH domain-containing protein n=1 Tax=Butyrivibrio hungatei TaxID=185008 RepID=A0A1D9NYA7_9FIRM|nr:helix-turn-helix transcriptional regulator [Butyrivibrio hungatei]AOZ95327.1 HTH domain-containing protein [Butyrivibrio hungatei]